MNPPAADEPPLPGRRPVAGQHVTQRRMAPPPGSRSRHRIDSCAHATPDPIHVASRLSRTPTCIHGPPITTTMRTPDGWVDISPRVREIRRRHMDSCGRWGKGTSTAPEWQGAGIWCDLLRIGYRFGIRRGPSVRAKGSARRCRAKRRRWRRTASSLAVLIGSPICDGALPFVPAGWAGD